MKMPVDVVDAIIRFGSLFVAGLCVWIWATRRRRS